jgi:hypothetical protein
MDEAYRAKVSNLLGSTLLGKHENDGKIKLVDFFFVYMVSVPFFIFRHLEI